MMRYVVRWNMWCEARKVLCLWGFLHSSHHILFCEELCCRSVCSQTARYVQNLISFFSGASASFLRPIGRGAKHVFVTSGIAGHTAVNALAIREAVASDRSHAGETSARSNLARSHRPFCPALGETPAATSSRTKPKVNAV